MLIPYGSSNHEGFVPLSLKTEGTMVGHGSVGFPKKGIVKHGEYPFVANYDSASHFGVAYFHLMSEGPQEPLQ